MPLLAPPPRPASPSFAALPAHIATPARAARFWSHVARADGDGCWPWTEERRERKGSPRGGYGVFVIEAGGLWVRFKAHRLAWELSRGPIPAGLLVQHTCDVRLCCRPDHLFLGTHRVNSHDMMRKGRWGGRVPPTLTPEQVREVRRRLAAGECVCTVAREAGTRRDLVRAIIAGKAYAWIT